MVALVRATRNPLTVLLPVRNGARFLPGQLRSLAQQELLPDRLIVSDDRSDDASLTIVREFARRAPFDVDIIRGSGNGLACNVHRLLRNAPDGRVAFCDQDDVWLPHRLRDACRSLDTASGPAIGLCARVVTDEVLGHRYLETPPSSASFANALVQNCAPANATVLNAEAAMTIRRALPDPHAMHPWPDWWIYAVITGAGGHVIGDARAGLLYRQHDGNLIGARCGMAEMLRRLKHLFDGSYGKRLRIHLRALDQSREHLTPASRHKLDALRRALSARHPDLSRCEARRYGAGQQFLLHVASRLRCL